MYGTDSCREMEEEEEREKQKNQAKTAAVPPPLGSEKAVALYSRQKRAELIVGDFLKTFSKIN